MAGDGTISQTEHQKNSQNILSIENMITRDNSFVGSMFIRQKITELLFS